MNAVSTFQITVGGTKLADPLTGQLVEAYVDDSLTLPDLFVLTFLDPDRSVIPDGGFEIGKKVTISVVSDDDPGGQKLIADAEITALEAEFDATGTYTVVRGFDQSHRLIGGRRTEAYKNMSYSDIAGQVATRAGLGQGTIKATRPIFEHVAQANTSDWQFLWGMAREVGYEVRVVNGQLDFAPPVEASGAPQPGNYRSEEPLQLVFGHNLRRFRSVISSAEQVGEVKVRSWDPKEKRELIGAAPAKSSGAALAGKGASVTPAALAAKFGNPSYVSVDVPYASQGECEGAAKAIAEEIGSSFAAFDGVALGSPHLKAGSTVSLGLAGEPFDGRYTLTTTRHLFDSDGYSTWFTVSGSLDRTLLGLASGAAGPRTKGSSASGPPIAGVVPAIVTDAKDPEKLGRVKIKLPWLSDTYETDWVRTAQMWAGNGYGSLVAPEVGDEVLVAFELGDLRRPYVVGGLYNGKDKPLPGELPLVDDTSGKVQKRMLASRTGHLLVFAEKPGQNDGILLQTSDAKYVLKLSKNARTVTLSADGSIEIDATGAPGGITIKADGPLELSGREVAIKGQTGVQIDGGGGKVAITGTQVAIQGQAEAELKSSGILQLQGSLVKIN